MTTGRSYIIAAIITSTLLITYLHYSANPKIHALHNIYREFYYIPIFLGALVFGLKGAISTYLLVFVLYLPYIFASWTGIFITEANRFLHLLLQGFFAFLAGYLIDRNRKHREQLEKERYLAGIGQAAATIVHDLKNPIITILGFAQRIHEGKGNTDTAIQAIIDSANNMQKIVYDVLDFAKPIQLNLKENEDIRNVINQACNSCKIKADEKEIDLLIDLPANPVNIAIDNFHIEKAIVNLINNAIEASTKGQKVTINMMPEKNYLIIKIKDQGLGMDKETLKNIFIPFYTKKSKGTGLGMSIVKKVIEGHQGKIRIESQIGKGTDVTIELPYKLKRNEGTTEKDEL